MPIIFILLVKEDNEKLEIAHLKEFTKGVL